MHLLLQTGKYIIVSSFKDLEHKKQTGVTKHNIIVYTVHGERSEQALQSLRSFRFYFSKKEEWWKGLCEIEREIKKERGGNVEGKEEATMNFTLRVAHSVISAVPLIHPDR